MDHFVKVDRFPPELQFPAGFSERIEYDGAGHRLVHHGFMSKAEFDQLWLLSEDWAYRRSLEELFRLCTEDDQTTASPPRGLRRLFAPLFRGTSTSPP